MHRLLGMRPSALVASSRRWLECRCMELRAGIASRTMSFLGHSNVANLSTTEQTQTTNQRERERETERERDRERERERDQANLEGGRELELGLDVWIRLETCLVDGSGAVGSRYSELLEGRRALRHKVEALSLASRCGQRCCGWGLVGVEEEAAVLLVVEDWSPSSSSGVRATGPKIDPFKATNQPMRVSE